MGNKQKPDALEEELPSTSSEEMSRVMYIGHLPHGFYEQQLRGFFGQFGQVTRLKVSRNKKTGRAKHYAFLEFKSPEVAQIAAEAMDGYMLFTQKLDCHVLPVSQLHADLFKGTNKPFRKVPWRKIEAERHNRERTTEQQEERLRRAIARDEKRKELLEKAGIKYDYKPLSQQKQELSVPAEAKAKKPAKTAKEAVASGLQDVVERAKVARKANTKVVPKISKQAKASKSRRLD